MMEKPQDQAYETPLVDRLRKAFSQPLPGLSEQLRMAPAYRMEALQNRTPPPNHKEAGVLILFYPCDDQLCFPLAKRTDTVETHRGQIALPGGAREGDETLLDTAVRETCEELSACADGWTVLGRLTALYVPPSGFLIHPFVAFAPHRPAFEPDGVEVAELIETPLRTLLDPGTVVWEEWTLRGLPVAVPFYNIHGHKVWGATAMVLSELAYLMREVSG